MSTSVAQPCFFQWYSVAISPYSSSVFVPIFKEEPTIYIITLDLHSHLLHDVYLVMWIPLRKTIKCGPVKRKSNIECWDNLFIVWFCSKTVYEIQVRSAECVGSHWWNYKQNISIMIYTACCIDFIVVLPKLTPFLRYQLSRMERILSQFPIETLGSFGRSIKYNYDLTFMDSFLLDVTFPEIWRLSNCSQ